MRIARSTFALFALSAAGCAVDAAAPDLAVDAPPLAESWTVSTTASIDLWSSGLNANLSDWRHIHCYEDHGEGYMLTGINVHQEDIADPDEFVARMTGECREFDLTDPALPRTGGFATSNIFQAPLFRTGVFQLEVTNNNYPIGLDLKVDGNDDYVKDVRIVYAPKNLAQTALNLAATSRTSWAFGYAGGKVSLSCPAQSVMTGLALRFDEVEGKIRTLKIHCRDLQP
ncbi:hypothetical protein BE04_00315 [Sorangium cellulosum]|uniref:Secreted protein n=1 Tax=Sorangium cellulosum TaxID=56 RepID=A0A150PR38_SORCE|nr:hypothetical protein BE04_00315 [Sorangium cellulosum]